MPKNNKKIIFPDSPEAAEYITVKLWKSANGNFYLDEKPARYDGATHTKCPKCEKAALKPYILCKACQEISEKEQYEALPNEPWDGKSMLYSRIKEEYYSSPDEAEDCLEEGETLADLRLVLCTPLYARSLDIDYFEGCLPSEYEEGPDWLEDAIQTFNATLKGHEPLSWIPGNIAFKE